MMAAALGSPSMNPLANSVLEKHPFGSPLSSLRR